MTVRRSVGLVDTYPGGPRALAREVGLHLPGGTLSYEAVEDAAVEQYAVRCGRPRLLVSSSMAREGTQQPRSRPATRSASVTKAPAPNVRQEGAQ